MANIPASAAATGDPSASTSGNIVPESSTHGSRDSRGSTLSTHSTIKEILDQRGYLHCILHQTWDGEWVIRAAGPDGGASRPPPPVRPGGGSSTQGGGQGGRPAWAGPYSGELLQRLSVLSGNERDLSSRMRTLYIPSPADHGLRLFFDADGNDPSSISRPDGEWTVLTSDAHRPNDDWGLTSEEFPAGYTLRRSSHPSGRRSDYLDYVISEILYPQTADASALEGLPRFVLHIGRVGWRQKDHDNDDSDGGGKRVMGRSPPPPSPSSYVVVMDVASPAKPLWLVHDAYTTSADVDLPDERQHAPGLPFAAGVFDIAPLADSVGEWITAGSDSGDGNCGRGSAGSASIASAPAPAAGVGLSLARVRERIARDGRLVKPMFSVTWHSRVVDAVWKGYGRG